MCDGVLLVCVCVREPDTIASVCVRRCVGCVTVGVLFRVRASRRVVCVRVSQCVVCVCDSASCRCVTVCDCACVCVYGRVCACVCVTVCV